MSSFGNALGSGISGASIGTMVAPGIGTAIGGGLGFLAGLFTGADTVDTSMYDNRARYLTNKAKTFYDPNSKFYRDAINIQKKSLLDMMLTGNRMTINNLARKGIRSSRLNQMYNTASANKSVEEANVFGNNLYRTGLGYAGNLESEADKMYGISANLRSGNTTSQGSFTNSMLSMGLGFAGNVLAHNPFGNDPNKSYVPGWNEFVQRMNNSNYKNNNYLGSSINNSNNGNINNSNNGIINNDSNSGYPPLL